MPQQKKSCPKCGITGRIDTLFGYRKIKYDCIIPQSYCTSCRSKEARRLYHQKKEKPIPESELGYPYSPELLKTIYAMEYPNDKTRRGLPDKLKKLKRKGVVPQSAWIQNEKSR